MIQVHGGYQVDFFADNIQQQGMIQKSFWPWNKGKGEIKKGVLEEVGDRNVSDEHSANYDGTITVQIGERTRLSNLIMTQFNVTPSLVQVRGSESDTPKPLYYKVDMQFQTCRAALEADVENLF